MKIMNKAEEKKSKDIEEAIIEEEPKKEKIEKKESTEFVEKKEKIKEAEIEPVEENKEEEKKDYLLEEYYRRKSKNKTGEVSGFKLFIIIVIAFITGGIVMVGLSRFVPILESAIDTNGINTITKNETQVYEKSSLAPAVEKIYDAVVLVQCYSNDELASSGTGFVYKVDSKYGYILTNAHVVNDMEKVEVTFTDDEEAEVQVLGKDSYLDLAVLRVDKKYVSLVANIGSSEKVNLGDTVFTVGSPMGYDYRGSVTSGILSGKDRMVTVSVGSYSEDWVMRVLQIDASINPGNSGGPLLNVNGEVIGICSMKLVDSEIEGMGFAIPIEYAMSHVEQLENGEKIEWPVLGISMANLTDLANLYRYNVRVPDGVDEGVAVVEVQKDSAADKAGIKVGDIVTKLGDKDVKNIAYLRYELYQYSAGEEVEVTFLRDGKAETVKVTLGKSS